MVQIRLDGRLNSLRVGLFLLTGIGFGLTVVNAEDVQVKLPSGAVVTGRSSSGQDTFNGIPYALPPVGPLRLRPPQNLADNYSEAVDARGIAAACPQLLVSPADASVVAKVASAALRLPGFDRLTGQEDCLTVSVQRPAGLNPGAKLPVLFWIYGGGFAFGSSNRYDGSSMLSEGMKSGKPFIYVAVNYRLNGFGFLPGAEVLQDGSTNLGLLDQRKGLEWVADNIAAFGGDPEKVTIWGESAGAHSVFYQMALHGGNATYKGRPLFRGAIMNSGTGVPSQPADGPTGQAVYDTVVQEAGCAGTLDTLECLRAVDYETYHRAVTEKFNSAFSFYGTKISFLPRPDGEVLTASAEDIASSGRYFAVPTIVGNQEDEGTLFSLFQGSIKSDTELVDYFKSNFLADVPEEQLADWVASYTKNGVGSPFRTAKTNSAYPMFRTIAAMIGDHSFIMGRRQFLRSAAAAHPGVPTWSYLSSYFHALPVLGTCHGSDVVEIFYGVPRTRATTSLRRYYLNFLYNNDPNVGDGAATAGDSLMSWPRWGENKMLLWLETPFKNGYVTDDFRGEQEAALLKFGDKVRQ